MGDWAACLTENLAGYFSLLRKAGLGIGPSDTVSAMQALAFVDIADRQAVRTVLCACLAKGRQELDLASRAFDMYFVQPAERRELIDYRRQAHEDRRRQAEEATASLKFQGESLELPDELKETFLEISDAEKKGIEEFLEKTSTGRNVKPEFRHVAEKVVKGRLSRLRREYAGRGPASGAAMLADASDTSDAGVVAGAVSESLREQAGLLHKNIGDFSESELHAAVRLIRLLVGKLRRELDRWHKRSGKKAGLDLKRTLRSNMSTGQALFRLEYKRRSRIKKRLLVMCDVSASMYRFSGFALQFMAGMSSGFSLAENYIFSDEVRKININPFFNTLEFSEAVKASGVWGKGTDIGSSLKGVLDGRQQSIASSTVLVIVSDAKTVDPAGAANRLKELKDRVREIIWLNPIPESDWRDVRGISLFQRHCTMLECSTLARLAAACARLGAL